jgi:hypothetical protein
MRGIWTLDPKPPEQVGLVRASMYMAGAMEDVADLNAATEQILAGSLDVGDDQIKPLGGSGSCRLPKMTEHPEPGGVN